MKTEIMNDELFVLCALAGCTRVSGIANPFIAMDDDAISDRIQRITNGLLEKGYIAKSEKGYDLCDTIKNSVMMISEPEILCIFADEDGEDDEYLFVKNDQALTFKSENLENCCLEILETQNERDGFFSKKLGIEGKTSMLDGEIIEIPTDKIEKTMVKAETEGIVEAVESISKENSDKKEFKSIISAMVAPDKTQTIITVVYENKKVTEKLSKLCTIGEDAWIITVSTYDEARSTRIYNAYESNISKILLNI